MNRFAVEEFDKTSNKISFSNSEYNLEYKNFEEERKQKRMDLSL